MHIFGTQLYGGSEWVYKFRFATLWDIRRYMVGGQQGIDGSKCSIWKHLKLGHVEILDQKMTWISFLLMTLVNSSHRIKLTIRHPLKYKTEIEGHFNGNWVHNTLGLTLELFRKLIRFGTATRPLVQQVTSIPGEALALLRSSKFALVQWGSETCCLGIESDGGKIQCHVLFVQFCRPLSAGWGFRWSRWPELEANLVRQKSLCFVFCFVAVEH